MTILIADKDEHFRAVLKRILERDRGCGTVWETGDGEEAVQLARQLQPDLVLMDLVLPRLDGLEATRLIKDKQPGAQVIILTAHDEEIYRRAALRNGADAFIPKSECWTGLAS